MRIDPEEIKNIGQNRFFNYYILLSVFRTHKYLVSEKMRCKQSATFFYQTLHVLPRSLGSICKSKNICTALFTTDSFTNSTNTILSFHI